MNCVNSVGSYMCVCLPGFYGKTCQRNGTEGVVKQTTLNTTSNRESDVSFM